MRSRQSLRRSFRGESLEDRCVLSITPLAGDYSGNNSVGPEDHVIWAQSYGSSTDLRADGNSDGRIDAADYTVWRDNNGQTRTPAPFLNLVVEGLGEAAETAPGAIVFRNSDFSKQDQFSTQPESGLPLYQPDYLADPSIYDLNANEDFASGSLRIDPSMIGDYQVRLTFGSDIRLWTTTLWPGMTGVPGGRFQIPSGTFLTPATVHLDFQIEGLLSSSGFGTESILVDAISTSTGPALTDEANYTVVDTGIGVDGNRDRNIDFESSHDRQLLFWLNNDQEGQHPTDDLFEFEATTIVSPDNTDGVIGQRRDLEDFAPLRIKVDDLLKENTFDVGLGGSQLPGELAVSYRLLLENADGISLRLFDAASDSDNVIEHVESFIAATSQVFDSTYGQELAPAFSDELLLGTTSGGVDTYLFEAIGGLLRSGFDAQPTLVFEVQVDYGGGKFSTKRHTIDLDLRDIRDLYTRWDIDYGVNGGEPGVDLRQDPSFQNFATPAMETHESDVLTAPFWSGSDTVVFVHGWNNSDDPDLDDKSATAETMLKRLYWQGFRGQFVTFNWPTFTDREADLNYFDLVQLPEWLALSYNPSEFQALRSANALKEVLETYRDPEGALNPVHLYAHSMGNMVAGEALKLWADNFDNEEALVTTYIAMQGAASAGAWGNNATDSDVFGRPVPDLYRFWQHGRDGISNPSLGAQSFWSGAGFSAENQYNFYNEDDFALGWWDFNNFSKDQYVQSFVWPFDYDFGFGNGGNVNDDTFIRFPPFLGEALDLASDINIPNDLRDLGPNAYEIVAFFSQSASKPIGARPMDVGFSPWEGDVDISTYDLLGGTDILINHSYQFGHYAAETKPFYDDLRILSGFATTFANVIDVPGMALAAASGIDIPANWDRSQSTELTGRGLYVPPPRTLSGEKVGRNVATIAPSAVAIAVDEALLLLTASVTSFTREVGELEPLFSPQDNDEETPPLSLTQAIDV